MHSSRLQRICSDPTCRSVHLSFAVRTRISYVLLCRVLVNNAFSLHTDFNLLILKGTVQEVDAIIEAGGPGSEAFLDASGADGEYFVLMCVLKQFISQVREVDAIIPPCRLVNGAIEIVETCVRFQIDSVFRKLRHGTIDLLSDVHHVVTQNQQLSRSSSQSSKSQQIQQAAQETAHTFTNMMQQVLRQMEPLVQTGATVLQEMSRLFSELVQVMDDVFVAMCRGIIPTCCCVHRLNSTSSSSGLTIRC